MQPGRQNCLSLRIKRPCVLHACHPASPLHILGKTHHSSSLPTSESPLLLLHSSSNLSEVRLMMIPACESIFLHVPAGTRQYRCLACGGRYCLLPQVSFWRPESDSLGILLAPKNYPCPTACADIRAVVARPKWAWSVLQCVGGLRNVLKQ